MKIHTQSPQRDWHAWMQTKQHSNRGWQSGDMGKLVMKANIKY